MTPELFKPTRACICCERTATPRKRVAGEPNIVAISFVLYFRGTGKRVLQAARKVRICTDCLAKALAEPRLWQGTESRKFVAAIRESLSVRYSAILEEDARLHAVTPTHDGQADLLEGVE